tara:strand:+ start:872 stop:1375 length:504 start_codon:yes stop_codon:yes gene_type:complete
MGNCTCKQTSLDLEAELRLANDEEEEILPPTESEEKQDEEEELLEEEDVEAEDDEEELEMDDEEEELELHDEKKDLGKLKDMLMAAVKYLDENDKQASEEVTEVGKALATLKKNGVNVYAGAKKTPAPKRVAVKAPAQTNWMDFSKSIDEINLEEERSNGGMYTWQG